MSVIDDISFGLNGISSLLLHLFYHSFIDLNLIFSYNNSLGFVDRTDLVKPFCISNLLYFESTLRIYIQDTFE